MWIFDRRRPTRPPRLRRLRRLGLVGLCTTFAHCPINVAAQAVSLELGDAPRAPSAPAPTQNSPYGRRVVAVHFQPAALRTTDLSLKPGLTLTPENLSAAMNQLAGQLGRHSELIAAYTGGSALVVTYVDARFELNPAGNDTVAVTLRPFHLFLPLDEAGARILPVPRGLSAGAAAREMPTPFLPARLTMAVDRSLGPTIGSDWQFNFGPIGAANAAAPQVRVRAGGMKSLDSTLYSGHAAVRVSRERQTGLVRQISAGLEAATARDPRGAVRYDFNSWNGVVGASLSLNANTRLLAEARYTSIRHRYLESPAAASWASTHEQANRLVFETIPPRLLGFFRAALWQDTLFAGRSGTAQRLATRAGYSREIPVGVNQSVGFEVIAGAGQTWGNINRPRRFFAGGSQGEFLYESATAPALAALPDGPLVRSLGKAQGALRPTPSTTLGGTNFWHINLNIALPIPKWSRPLIPNEATDLPGPDGSPLTLKQILRTQIDRTGPNMLQSTLQTTDGLTPDDAKRRAAQIFDEIRPAAHFVIDQANVFALKPLLLFDAASLQASSQRASWTAAGLGVQLTIVTAKFEAGYMHTVNGPTFGSRGNLFARLGFERLF